MSRLVPWGMERWRSSWERLWLLQRTWVPLPVLTWCLIIIYTISSTRCMVLFWPWGKWANTCPPCVSAHTRMLTHTHAHGQTLIFIKLIINLKLEKPIHECFPRNVKKWRQAICPSPSIWLHPRRKDWHTLQVDSPWEQLAEDKEGSRRSPQSTGLYLCEMTAISKCIYSKNRFLAARNRKWWTGRKREGTVNGYRIFL